MSCPDLESLAQPTELISRHLLSCSSCRIASELVTQRQLAEAERERRGLCIRFELLIAARAAATLAGPAALLLDEHLRECAECGGVVDTVAPADHEQGIGLPRIDTGAYVLGREVARGGMGRILAARDVRIGRPVAVKELLSSSATVARRFEREARVTARLQHPGVVPIYEIGRWPDGTPFYAMRMVEGQTLRDAVEARATLDERLALLPAVIAAADAVAFAHGRRIIHRDLTPNNILVGDYGETVVIDWGLAKDLAAPDHEDPVAGPFRDESRPADLTVAGAVMGTAAFMPPEQARGEPVSERADVYALGAILYQVLSGEPPYRASSRDEALARVQAGPPPAIERLVPQTPRDLVSILGKAMARDPAARYPSAAALVDELRRFQTGRIVQAHHYSRGELTRRWVGRHRAAVVAAMGIFVAVAVIGGVSLQRVIRERDRATVARHAAVQDRTAAMQMSTSLLEELGRQELLAGRSDRAAALLSEAYGRGAPTASVRFLLAQAMRDVEAIETVVAGDGEKAEHIEFSADGQRILVVRSQSILVTFGGQVTTLAEPGVTFVRAHFAPTGDHVVTASADHKVRVWDVASGRPSALIDPGRPISSAGYTRDASSVIVVGFDGSWSAWSAHTGARTRMVEARRPSAKGAYLVRERLARVVDDLVVIASTEGVVSQWDWRTGRHVRDLDHGSAFASPYTVAIERDHVLTCGMDGRATLWDARSGQVLRTLVEPSGLLISCDLAADGRVITSSGTGATRSWAPDGRLTMSAEAGEPAIVRFVLGGARILTHAITGDVVLRDAATGATVLDLGTSVAIGSIDHQRVAVARPDGGVQIATLGASRLRADLRGATLRPEMLSEDGRLAVLRGRDGQLRVRDLTSGTTTEVGLSSPVYLSGDGRRIAGWGGTGVVVLDAASGRELHRFASASPEGLVLSHDGRRLAAWFPGGTVRMWSVDAGSELGVLRDVEQRILEFDRVGRLRLLADGGALDLWDPIVGTRRRIGEGVWMPMGESPDARYFAYSALGTGLHVVDTATGARTLHVPEMVGAFDAAGHFVTAQDGGELTIWSVTDWSRVRDLRIQSVGSGGGGGGLMAVSPDGALVASSSGIWSTTDGRQLASLGNEVAKTGMPGSQVEFTLDRTRFTADGAALIVENDRGTRIWDVRPELRAPRAIAQVLAARQTWRVVDGQLVQDDSRREVVRSAAIIGRVTRHGVGVAGVKVLVEIERDRRVPLATTGPDGRFEIVGLAPRAYAVGAASSDAFADPVSIVASDHPRSVDLELAWEGSIAGIVRDEDGVPLQDVVVRVQDPENTDVGAGVSNERGEFVIGALRGGQAYEVTLSDPARTILRAPSGPTRVVVATARTKVTGVEVVAARQARARPGIDPAFYYRLGTRWQGAGRSLDVINDGANDQLEFRTDAPYTGQHWRLEPAGDGLFRLSTAWEGEGKTLAIADDGASVHLVAGGGERWRLTPVGTGGYRLTSQSQGEARSLAGGRRLSLVDSAAHEDQTWILSATSRTVR